jgi:hypothetical protein
MYKFTRFEDAPKTTPYCSGSKSVNNCDGTSTLSATATGTFIMEYWGSTASITVQTGAAYTVTTTNASGCTSLQGSSVVAPKTTPLR